MSGLVLEIVAKPKGLLRRSKLSREQWEELAYAVVEVINNYLEQHLADAGEKAALELLDDVVEVDCEALDGGRIAFIFHEHWHLGAACGYHWYTHALASAWNEVAALFADRGQKIVGQKPDLAAEYGPRASYAFATQGDTLLAVYPNGETIVSTGRDEDECLRHDSEALDEDLRRLARQLYETGLCRCSLCERARPTTSEGSSAMERLPSDPEQPAWLAALHAAERGDLNALDGIIASKEHVDIDRCFEEGVKSPGAVTVAHLLKLGHGPTPEAVANAARHDAVEALRLMHDAGADIEARDEEGRSPLANAAMYGSVNALRFLLDAGAEVDALDEYHGRTALLWSLGEENGNPETIVTMLLAAGADPNAKDSCGRAAGEVLSFIDDDEKKAALAKALAAARPRGS